MNAWVCIMATGGTPQPVIQRLNSEVRRIMANPEIKEAFEKHGIPHLLVETEHEGVALESLKTRVDAFVEVVGRRATAAPVARVGATV